MNFSADSLLPSAVNRVIDRAPRGHLAADVSEARETLPKPFTVVTKGNHPATAYSSANTADARKNVNSAAASNAATARSTARPAMESSAKCSMMRICSEWESLIPRSPAKIKTKIKCSGMNM